MLVEISATGRRGGPSYEVPLDGTMPLRTLVARLVHDEVDSYERRRQERVLVRALTPGEVADGAGRGRVDSGGRRSSPAPPVEQAVATALEAFTDGLWFVFVDGVRVHDLDAPVTVGPSTTARFVRLVALAGG